VGNVTNGKFADMMCEVIGQRPDVRLDILATACKLNDDREEHWQLVLRPQVVEALRELKWF
jgi:hypothetical protein